MNLFENKSFVQTAFISWTIQWFLSNDI